MWMMRQAPPVRVRGRGAPASAETEAAGPTMAEQLGAVGGRPSADAGPDWAQTARSTSAPQWATEEVGPTDEAARRVERPTDGEIRPELDGQPPSSGGPDQQEREAVRSRRGPAADDVDSAPSEDDEDLTTTGAVGQPVIENVLGGTVIEINDEPVA